MLRKGVNFEAVRKAYVVTCNGKEMQFIDGQGEADAYTRLAGRTWLHLPKTMAVHIAACAAFAR